MPDLIQIEDLADALNAGGRPATAAQQSLLQAACDAASACAVKICGGRDFVRQVYTEICYPTQEGRVFLRQMPVNAVNRVSAGRSPAITIGCTMPVARAWVQFTLGALASDPPVGITLYSVTSGVTTKTPLAFASYADVAALGTAVSAVPGWQADVQDWALGYPCTDLVGARVATPAVSNGNYSDGGADIAAYANDIPARLDWRTGVLNLPAVELAGAEQFADPSWWPEVGGVSDDRIRRGSVLVQYDAGFDTVPPNVVAGTVLIAMALLDRWTADFTLASENLGNTTYTRVSPEMLRAVPQAARDYLGPYRIMRV